MFIKIFIIDKSKIKTSGFWFRWKTYLLFNQIRI